MLNNQIFIMVFRIREQKGSSNEALERDDNRVNSGNRFDLNKPQVSINPTSTANNASSIRLNKRELKSADVWNITFKH